MDGWQRRWVLVRHEPPSASPEQWHYDWFLGPASFRVPGDTDMRDVVSFRVWERPDAPGLREFDAQRMAEHRRFYLDHEGRIPGPADRGCVVRIAEGACDVTESGDRRITIRMRDQDVRIWIGRRIVDNAGPPDMSLWRFTLAGGA
jgi:hypothetical protein